MANEQTCFMCYETKVSYLQLNVKGEGDCYVPVCQKHLEGCWGWRDFNTVLEGMGIKSRIKPATEIKYCKMTRQIAQPEPC